MMKCYIVSKPKDPLQLTTRPIPTPSENELLIKVLRDPDSYPAEKQDLSINSYAEKITEEEVDFPINFKYIK